MSTIAPGLNHLIQYAGRSDIGWRLLPGWELAEILGFSHLGDQEGSYVMFAHVRVAEDYKGELNWPPIVEGPEPGP